MRVTSLISSVEYSGTANPVRWEGRVVDDRERFGRYMYEVVRQRVTDEASSFDAELQGLATTGLETRFVEWLLRAISAPEGWEIGEAFAECVLRDYSDRQVHWPWNTVRDRRTPQASLPGAELVGFYCNKQVRRERRVSSVRRSENGTTSRATRWSTVWTKSAPPPRHHDQSIQDRRSSLQGSGGAYRRKTVLVLLRSPAVRRHIAGHRSHRDAADRRAKYLRGNLVSNQPICRESLHGCVR